MTPSDPDDALDPPSARREREALVKMLVARGDMAEPEVIEALRAVPRHLFVPPMLRDLAYANHPLDIGHGQTISQPTIVAVMTEALELRGSERVLEIGTGSGYQAAILSLLAGSVYSIERVDALAVEASERLRSLGYRNVHVRSGDGFLGWPEAAPFDRVLLTAAPTTLPPALIDQLADGGILIAPVGDQDPGDQSLVKLRKVGGEIVTSELGGVRFVPMLEGIERA